MIVVTGYKVIGGQNWVSINDPWAPNHGGQRDILGQIMSAAGGWSPRSSDLLPRPGQVLLMGNRLIASPLFEPIGLAAWASTR